MKHFWNRWRRWVAPGVLGLCMAITPAYTPMARAQEPVDPSGEGDKGRPLDGYLATITLMLLALYLVGKSARR
jgi:hypothetical protein